VLHLKAQKRAAGSQYMEFSPDIGGEAGLTSARGFRCLRLAK